jgi:uncharacterized protein DUF5678
MSEEHSRLHLGELLRGFDGKWVATKDGEVVLAADTPYLLIGRLRERGIEGAAVIRAPAPDEPEMVSFG